MGRKLPHSARGVLSAQFVKSVSERGHYADGGNLYLQVGPTGNKSWVFRYYKGKQRTMGLGPYSDVSLSEARTLATDNRALLRNDIDPIEERENQKRNKAINAITFEDTALELIKAKVSSWSIKHHSQFVNTLTTYAFPLIGKIPISKLETSHVLGVLKPIWESKNETASRIRGRIEAVVDYANAVGLREGDNPARWKGHLSHLLPSRSKVSPVQHLEALPYSQMPAFMLKLADREGVSPRSLELCILTAMRIGAVIGAKWDEFDDEVWTIPAGRMKGLTGEFKVPLSSTAMAVLERLPRASGEVYLFPSKDAHITIAAPLRLLQKRMEYKDLTVHGFRSTFRDWSAEATDYPNHICEMALAHAIESGVEKAYRRGDLFNKRAKLMEDWATYLKS